MSDGPHGVIEDAFNQLAQFEPQTAGEWNQFLAAQPEMWASVSQSLTTLADRARSGQAYDQAVASRLDDLAAAVAAVADIGADAHQAFGHDS